jgi:predicted nucleic acid-binding protein
MGLRWTEAGRRGRSLVKTGLMVLERVEAHPQKEIDVKKRFAIAADAALLLAERRAKVPENHSMVAPTLLRSQVLTQLYAAVRHGDLQRKEADMRLDHIRKLRIRLLGDRVLQRHAWAIASKLDWADTYWAEYIAVTQLQADVLLTADHDLAAAARSFVEVSSVEALLSAGA